MGKRSRYGVLIAGVLAILGYCVFDGSREVAGAAVDSRRTPSLLEEGSPQDRAATKFREREATKDGAKAPPRSRHFAKAEATRISSLYPYVGSDYSPDKAPLIGFDGKIPHQIIAEFGLSEKESKEIQASMDLHRIRMSELVASHMKEDALRSDGEKNIRAFVIGAFEDAGADAFGEFVEDLDQVVGEAMARKLLARHLIGNSYSGMGRHETLVQVGDYDTRGLPEGMKISDDLKIRVSYQMLDPSNGKPVGSGETTVKNFNATFGDLISSDGSRR